MSQRDTNDVQLIFVGTSDFAGIVRGKAFPLADLAERTIHGVGLTHSNIMISAFGRIDVTPFGTLGDLKLVPDMSTRTTVGNADDTASELVLGDIRTLDDEPWSCCPRDFLRRGIERLEAEFGLRLFCAFEQEFVYDGVAEKPGSSYAFDRYRRSGSFGPRIIAALRAAGIFPDSFLPEYGERQFEVTVKPRHGVRAADEAVLLREIVRACAAQASANAIFAPVLEPNGTGNGTHIHFSLQDRAGEPVMYDPYRPLRINKAAEPFVAGLLDHLPALTALTAPSVASFYRLRPNKWAPTYANIGANDRGAALRVCPTFARDARGIARQFNVEYRIGDATASPYLALGAIVHAGLDGLRRNLALPMVAPGSQSTQSAVPGEHVRQLPQTLSAALDLLERTDAAQDWLGAELLATYLLFKRAEIEAVADLSEADVCRRYVEVY